VEAGFVVGKKKTRADGDCVGGKGGDELEKSPGGVREREKRKIMEMVIASARHRSK
jgi:hypothetical protein